MKNIQRWLDKKLINEELALVLEKELKEQQNKNLKLTTQILLYTIGVVLISIAVVCFIAANDWILEILKQIPLLKPLILLSFSVSSLWAGWFFKYEKKSYTRLADALIFLSSLLIGSVYILIGQMYNWNSNVSSILALWFLSVFPLGFIFSNKAINWLSIILFVVVFPYFYFDLGIDKSEVWTIFMPFTLCGILYTFANLQIIKEKFSTFSTSYKLTALIPAFFTFLILIFSVNPSYEMGNCYYIAIPLVLLIVNLGNYFCSQDKLLKLESGFLALLMIFTLSLLIASSVNPVCINICSHCFLIYIISNGLYWGYRYENVSLVNLNNIFLIIYILCIYSRYGWDYIDKTLFFLIGGLILISIGVYLEKGKNRMINNKNKKEEIED